MIYCVLLNPTLDKILEIPNFEVGGTFQIASQHEFPVGKAISVALTLRELGEQVKVISFISKEDFSQYDSFLKNRDIDHIFIPVDGKTRSNTTIIDPINKTTTHIRFPGFKVTQKNIENLEQIIKEQVNVDDIVVVSGSFAPGIPSDYHIRLSDIVTQKKAKIIIDTSGKPLETLLSVHPFIIKANLEEMGKIIGKNLIETQELTGEPDFQTLKKLASTCRNNIKINSRFNILTLGKYGAILIDPDNCLYARVKMDNAVYTVGCGDAFLGGVIAGIQRNYTTEDILRLATACGAANTQMLGAGILSKKDVDKFVSMVKIETL